MDRDLEKLIEGRKRQAQKRNIIRKVEMVVKTLGTPLNFQNDDVTEEGYQYDNGLMRIVRLNVDAFPTHGFSGQNFVHIVIKYDGKIRFESEDSQIKAYAPGAWENCLMEFYDKALAASAVDKAEKEYRANKLKNEGEAELRKKWGL